MRKLGVVFRREYMERLRSKWFIIGTLLGPVFFGMITIAPTYIAMKQGPTKDLTKIVILDATGAGLGARISTELGKHFPADPAPPVRTVAPDGLRKAEDRAVSEVADHVYNGFIVLDSNTAAN